MFCNNCGTDIKKDDARFCPKCGATIEQPVVLEQRESLKTSTQEVFPHDLSAIWPEWQIEKRIGKGSYGVVYQVIRKDNHVESHAAVKIISIPTDVSEVDSLRSEGLDIEGTRTYFKGIVDDFVGEIQLMESMKGIQNIVSVEDYKVVEKKEGIGWDIYIRMELLTPFNDYICGKTLDEQTVIKLGCDICTALEICEQKNIIHRDIKPENIFVNDFGHFKLGDFGIARKLENMTGGLSQKGTYNYMAPEVVNSNAYDARVDTYSLGIVLYRLLNNNKFPFLDTEKQLLNPVERKAAVERRIRGEQLPAPCNASPQMADLILRTCAYNPDVRFASATQMKQALISVENGTYVAIDTGLDKTTSVRPATETYDATTTVRKATAAFAQNEVPIVNTFGDAPKKKAGKVTKGKVIAFSVLLGIVALTVVLTAMFFSSSAYGVYRDMKSEDFENAIQTYNNEVEDDFIQKTLLNMLLKGRVDAVVSEFESEKIDYNTAISELNALADMRFEGAKKKAQAIEDKNNAQIAFDRGNALFATGDYDKAILEYNKVPESDTHYEEAQSKIAECNKSKSDAVLDKANAYYADGDYIKAIEEYEKIPQSDENYEKAQSKINEICPKYISSIVNTATDYNNSGKYKEAVSYINTAYDILPAGADTTELDKVKNESLAFYKTDISNQVTALINESNFTEAFKVIDEAIAFDNDKYFKDLKTTTENKYVESIKTVIQGYLKNEDYISAERVASNALTVLPGNSELTKLQSDVKKATPIYLLDVLKPYQTGEDYKEYINGETFILGGVETTNGFTLPASGSYALFNVNGQYSSLNFLIGHVANTYTHSINAKIILDGKLNKTIHVTSDDYASQIKIDITGVKQVKIQVEVDGDNMGSAYSFYGFGNVTVK